MVSAVQPPPVDLEPAIKEMTRGYDLAVQLHCILLAQKSETRSMTLDLVEKILRAFKTSLDALKPPTKSSNVRVEAKEAPKPSKNVISTPDNGEDGGENSRNCIYSLERRKGKDESRKVVTSTPHHDGYQWRKYGEKKIRGTVFPRCYYRCTYLHDQNCQATKQVQQMNSDDPPLFDVTYNRRHTCYSASGLKQNGECPPQSKDGYPTCIVFGIAGMDDDDDDDDEVTIVSSSSTNSREIDPAVLRQLNQDAAKRQRINPPVGSTQQVARNIPAVVPSPSPSGVTTLGSASPSIQPVSTAREETSMDSALLRHLNQEATEMLRRTSVMAPTPLSVAGPTPLSVAGPTPLSVVGPAAYSAAGRSPSERGATPTSVGPSSSVVPAVRSAVLHVHPITTSREKMALDPSLMRHVNQEAVKRMKTGSNFGAIPSSVGGPTTTNAGDSSSAPRPRHCASFPPFTFSTTRFERSMSQNEGSIESLFTLPSERSLDPKIGKSNSQFWTQMEGRLTGPRVEGSPSVNAVNSKGGRVKRSLSDNGIQMEGPSQALLTQKSPNISFVNPSLTRVRRSLAQEQNEMEGVYTLSSMDMLNLANPNSSRLDDGPTNINSENPNTRSKTSSTDSNHYTSRFRNLLRNRSQMEGALSMSPMDKKLFLETALADASNAANAKAKETDKNEAEGMPSMSAPERSIDASTESHDTNKGENIIYQNVNQINGVFSRSPAGRSYETNSANHNENKENKTMWRSRSQKGIVVSLSKLERSPGMSTVNPSSNEDNQAEVEAALSLSSKRPSDANLVSHKESSIGIELSLSSVERAHTTKGAAKSLSQGRGEMEGVLSLSSMERLPDASATKPASHSEMASILTLASIDGSTPERNPDPANSNTITGEKSLLLHKDRMEANLSLSSMERSIDTNLVKAEAKGAERSLVLQPGQMKDGLTAEKNSPEMNSDNLRLLNKADDRNSSIENQGQMEGVSNLSQVENLPGTNPCTEHQGLREEDMPRLPSAERPSDAGLRESTQIQMETTSVSSMDRSSDTTGVQPDVTVLQRHEVLLELNFPPRSPMPPTEQPPPSQPLLPPPPPMTELSQGSKKSNEEIALLEETVAKLRSKLEHSKVEAVTTKEKVTTLEAEISAIKAATEAWQRIMAEEASKRVAEAVSRFTSALHAGPSEASRRTEILFPGAENDDDSAVEVPSLLSQLEKNK